MGGAWSLSSWEGLFLTQGCVTSTLPRELQKSVSVAFPSPASPLPPLLPSVRCSSGGSSYIKVNLHKGRGSFFSALDYPEINANSLDRKTCWQFQGATKLASIPYEVNIFYLPENTIQMLFCLIVTPSTVFAEHPCAQHCAGSWEYRHSSGLTELRVLQKMH